MNRRCEFVAAKKSRHATIEARRVAGVSKGSWYRWLAGGARRSAHQAEDQRLGKRIVEIWKASDRAYGLPRILHELRAEGWQVNPKRVRRLMRERGVVSCMPFRPPRTTVRGAQPAAEDLVARTFTAAGPNQVWVSDITYVRTRQGWLYLAAFTDLFSRRVVGYAVSSRCDTKLVLRAFNQACRARKPGPGLIVHSDHGCQYTSQEFRAALRRLKARQSMGRVGTCYDNAVAESLWASLKKERLGRWRWDSHDEAVRAIRRYITWYNAARRHSTLGYVSPAQFELAAAA